MISVSPGISCRATSPRGAQARCRAQVLPLRTPPQTPAPCPPPGAAGPNGELQDWHGGTHTQTHTHTHAHTHTHTHTLTGGTHDVEARAYEHVSMRACVYVRTCDAPSSIASAHMIVKLRNDLVSASMTIHGLGKRHGGFRLRNAITACDSDQTHNNLLCTAFARWNKVQRW